jgi:hypothetical protein
MNIVSRGSLCIIIKALQADLHDNKWCNEDSAKQEDRIMLISTILISDVFILCFLCLGCSRNVTVLGMLIAANVKKCMPHFEIYSLERITSFCSLPMVLVLQESIEGPETQRL